MAKSQRRVVMDKLFSSDIASLPRYGNLKDFRVCVSMSPIQSTLYK